MTWGVRTMYAGEFFSNTMRTKFEEFRWCEGDWKVHVFATVRFPDWSEDVVPNPPSLSRKHPKTDSSTKKQKRAKKQHANAPPPADANAIDLVEDLSAPR